jgi:hypothetical protein
VIQVPFQKKKPADAPVATSASSETAVKSPKGYVDGTRYDAAAREVDGVIGQLDTLRKNLQKGATDVMRIEEERRQEAETYAFNLKMQRQAETAEFEKKFTARAAELDEREASLTASENELISLVGVTRADNHLATAKNIRLAFDAKIEAANKAGEGKGKAMAEATYTQQKKLDEANAATKNALLEQENKQLQARNAELKAQNDALLANQQKVVVDMKDVATGAFSAAGGLVGKSQDALANAAAGSTLGRPGR